MYSQCMPLTRISMTFELAGNTCALLLVGVAHALEGRPHATPSVISLRDYFNHQFCHLASGDV